MPTQLNEDVSETSTDLLGHYKFILLIRNQLLKTKPLKCADESELNNGHYKTLLNHLDYHYTQLMATFDILSNEVDLITAVYKTKM